MVLFARGSGVSAHLERGLQALVEQGAITPIDRLTGLALAYRTPEHSVLAAALGIWLSHLRGRGYVCGAMERLPGDPLWRRLHDVLEVPDDPTPGSVSALAGAPDATERPLMIERGRLYFHRAWFQERATAAALSARAVAVASARLPSKLPGSLSPGQAAAVETALTRRLCVISGGPGTGKTTVAGAIVAAYLDAYPAAAAIGLAAPTGKAAARLGASVNRSLAERPGAPALTARTVHRLLGWNRERAAFRYSRERRLPLRLLIVDEVSMVDLDLMQSLLAALEDDCALVLLGDREQLASVQPGNVLADICAGAERATGSELSRSIVLLGESYRFGADSGIGKLAAAVRCGYADGALELLRAGLPDLAWHGGGGSALPLPEEFMAGFSEPDPETALARFDSFRVLSAHRGGRYGSEAINRALIAQFRAQGLIGDARPGEFFEHQLFTVVGNHYGIGLYNGDQGILRRRGASLQAYVSQGQDRGRWIAPHRLPETRPGYALTVHRSQGSEFGKVLLILPDESSPLATRELLYTAITRARIGIEIRGSEAALRAAIGRTTERGSGLADRLWGASPAPPPPTAATRPGRPEQGELF